MTKQGVVLSAECGCALLFVQSTSALFLNAVDAGTKLTRGGLVGTVYGRYGTFRSQNFPHLFF